MYYWEKQQPLPFQKEMVLSYNLSKYLFYFWQTQVKLFSYICRCFHLTANHTNKYNKTNSI